MSAAMTRALCAVALLCAGEAARAEKSMRTHVAFVLLSAPSLPTGEELVRAQRAIAPGETPFRVTDAKKPPKGTLSLELTPKGSAVIALMPVVIPKGEAEDGAHLSLTFLGTEWKLPKYKAHLVVTLMDPPELSAVESLTRFTTLVTAVSEATHAVGVYWGGAYATHDPKFVSQVARKPGLAPHLMIWCGVSVAREPSGRISLLSIGMKQLDLPELLLTAPAGDDGTALATMFDLLAYVADRGQPLPEGDTVGRTETEKWPVHYVPSPMDAKTRVWRVEMR
jgi:hypothetical protein